MNIAEMAIKKSVITWTMTVLILFVLWSPNIPGPRLRKWKRK
jgi:hypothetical protein